MRWYNIAVEGEGYTINSDQRGFASLVIALVLITVLSLMTVGFAEIMRNEQRSALDKQLSSQAYYAAESGINDAAAAINAGFNMSKLACGAYTPTYVSSLPSTEQTGAALLENNTVGTNTASSYPCLLINPVPANLAYSSVGTTTSTVFEMEGVDPSSNTSTAITTVEISWQDAGGNRSFVPGSDSDCSKFYPVSGGSPNWTYTPVLRAELIPINDLSRTGLINNSETAFLCPDQSAAGQYSEYTLVGNKGNVSNHGNNGGVILSGNCSTAAPTSTSPLYCNAFISNLNSLDEATFFMALQSIYAPSEVTITAYGNDGRVKESNILNIAGAQTLVDSTGKAQDVLKRLQVRIPQHNDYGEFPGTAGIQGICKQLQLVPVGGSNQAPAANCSLP